MVYDEESLLDWIKELADQRDCAYAALLEIVRLDPIDCALDPELAQRIAIKALKNRRSKNEPI